MRYEFERCRIDTSTRQVTLDGAGKDVSPKAFDLLRLLLDARPRVVPKAEVMQALWPDTFVQEANVPVLIRELRVALGDADAVVIKTYHRVGYAFTAEVREARSTDNRRPAGSITVTLVLPDRHVVVADGEHTVGRQAGCDVQINDASVSRLHARMTVEGGLVRVVDLQSKNGTKVRGAAVTEPTVLTSGDVVTFGVVDVRLLTEDSSQSATKTV